MTSIRIGQDLSTALARLVREDLRDRGLPKASVVVAVVLAATAAHPALAVDATGTWVGRWNCAQRTNAGLTRLERRDGIMLVTHHGEALFVEIDGTAYEGYSHDSATSATRATGTAVRCVGGHDACTPASEVLDLRIRVNEARGIAKINGKSTVPDDRDAPRCRYRFWRTSYADPGIAPSAPEVCGDGIVNDAPNEECDGAATGTPCDGACTAACTCPTTCTPLDVSGAWAGTWVSGVTGQSGPIAATLSQDGAFVFGTISFPPFVDVVYSAPFIQVGVCAPAEFSTGAILGSGIVGVLEGIATNDSVAGTWALSDGSDHGAWEMSR